MEKTKQVKMTLETINHCADVVRNNRKGHYMILLSGVSVEEYNQQVDNRNRENAVHHENELFYMLCLSLVSNRDEIENQAVALANKHGLLGALRLQRTTAPCQNAQSSASA